MRIRGVRIRSQTQCPERSGSPPPALLVISYLAVVAVYPFDRSHFVLYRPLPCPPCDLADGSNVRRFPCDCSAILFLKWRRAGRLYRMLCTCPQDHRLVTRHNQIDRDVYCYVIRSKTALQNKIAVERHRHRATCSCLRFCLLRGLSGRRRQLL